MRQIEKHLDLYKEAFGEYPPLYQLRFYDDETAIELISKAIETQTKLKAEDLESVPEGAFY